MSIPTLTDPPTFPNIADIGSVFHERAVGAWSWLDGYHAELGVALEWQRDRLAETWAAALVANIDEQDLTGAGGYFLAVTSAEDGVEPVDVVEAPDLSQVQAEDDTDTTFGAVSGERMYQAVAAHAGTVISGTSSVVSTTSGAAALFAIPAGVDVIEIALHGVEFDGSSPNPVIQIGDAGGIETTGYVGCSVEYNGNLSTSTNGFIYGRAFSVSDPFSGIIRLVRLPGTNSWAAQGATGEGGTLAGSKTLSAELSQVSVNAPSGDSFGGGSLFVRWYSY